MQILRKTSLKMSATPTILLTTFLSISSLVGVGAQFFADYADAGGGGELHHLNPFDIPVIYKHRTFPASYPVAPTTYEMALMKAIEPMPGKKTVPLYIVPEDSLLVNPNGFHSRAKRSLDRHDPHGLRVNIKYPEFYGLTDGFHIPAVEVPLHKPMVVRQIEVNVLAPEGFMVPFHSEERQWPYPMTTGCLVASIPRNTYVGDDNPITIKRLFAVPSLPEYPTYRPAFPHGGSGVGYPTPPHGHGHGHGHGLHVHPHALPGHPHNGDGVTLNIFNGQQNLHKPHASRGRPKPPVFELVPVTTPKSRRRNGDRRNESDEDRDKDRSDEDKDNESESSREENSEEDERENRRCREGRNGRNCRRRNQDRRNNRNRDRDSTTRRTTTTTTRPTTTTTTASTTTPVASSIQDIIAAFSSFRDRERERDERKNRVSSSFYEDEERDRTKQQQDRRADRDRDRSRNDGLRSVSGNSERDRDRDSDRTGERDRDRVDVLRERERPQTQQSDTERENRESSRQFQVSRDAPSENNIQELKEQVLQRQINQLQRLLTSLNLSQDSNNTNTNARSDRSEQ